MSAIFFLLYHGHYVREVTLAGRLTFELVDRLRATPFVSQAEAWTAAVRLHLTPEQIQIENGNKGKAESGKQKAEMEKEAA